MKASRGMGAISPAKQPDSSKSAVLLKKGGKVGLYDNLNAKRKRIAAGSGEKMRKVGASGAPTAKDFINSAKTAKK